MPTDNFKKELSTEQETIQEARPRMCGWLLFQMAKDKWQPQQEQLLESSEKELPGLTQKGHSK